jgi:hypothetical protein
MRWLACLSLTLLLPALGDDNPVRKTVTSTKDFGQYVPLPALDKGHLLFMRHPMDGTVGVYRADGQRVFETVLHSPDGGLVRVNDAALDTDGAVAVAASLPPTRGGAVIFLDSAGKQTQFVPTGRYMPQHICFDRSHSAWVFGAQQDETMTGRFDREDYALVRRYSRDGKETGAFLQRSLFPGRGTHFAAGRGFFWTVRASDEKVGALAHYVELNRRKEWVEMDLDGNLLGRWSLPIPDVWIFPGRGMAFTSDGRFFIGTRDEESRKTNLLVLDRATGTFRPDGSRDLPPGVLLGADGNDLVFADQGGTKLTWYRPR